MRVLFVSINQQPLSKMTLDDLRVAASESWHITRAHAETCDYVVAMYRGYPVAAWTLEGSYKAERPEDAKARTWTGLLLGTPVPVQPLFHTAQPVLRNGACSMDFDA